MATIRTETKTWVRNKVKQDIRKIFLLFLQSEHLPFTIAQVLKETLKYKENQKTLLRIFKKKKKKTVLSLTHLDVQW